MRDPVVTLNSNGGDRELPEPGVSEGEDTAELVSDNQNNNINDGSSSNFGGMSSLQGCVKSQGNPNLSTCYTPT